MAGVSVIKGLTPGNKKLERIALFFNEINIKGAVLVPDMLANKTALKSIELNGNIFDADSDAVDAIRSALDRLEKPDALDELDEMEEEEEDEEEDDDEEEEAVTEILDEDDLAAKMAGVTLTK